MQKIPELVPRSGAPERESGLTFLRERLKDTSYIYAGTALLGMQRLHEASPSLVNRKEIAEAARRIIAEGAYATASKITALQILARHQLSEARTLARQWLTEEHPVMLRVSALATLGDAGESSDRDALTRYSTSPDLRLRTAARAALAKLNAR